MEMSIFTTMNGTQTESVTEDEILDIETSLF